MTLAFPLDIWTLLLQKSLAKKNREKLCIVRSYLRQKSRILDGKCIHLRDGWEN